MIQRPLLLNDKIGSYLYAKLLSTSGNTLLNRKDGEIYAKRDPVFIEEEMVGLNDIVKY